MLERWLDARAADDVRTAWTALAPTRHEFSTRDRTLTMYGAARLAEAMLGKRPDWITNVYSRPTVFQSRGDVEAVFLENAWDVNQYVNESWDVYEERDGAHGVQVVMVGVGSASGQPDGSSETVVRIFDSDRAASMRIGSNIVSTIGTVDLAPLDLLRFSHSHPLPNGVVVHAPLLAMLGYGGGLPWGYELDVSGSSIYGQLPNADIERIIAALPNIERVATEVAIAAQAKAIEDTKQAAISMANSPVPAWDWKGEGTFNPHFDATPSEEGIAYGCDTNGPFGGYDRVGAQTWDEFLAAGAPERVQMPPGIAAQIRAYALGRTVPRTP